MRLNLGAGSDHLPGWVNVDSMAIPGVDAVHDLDTFPWPWKDGSVARIRAYDVFEHVRNPDPFTRECWRVLRPGGLLDIHTCGVMTDARGNTKISPNYWRDPDHQRACDPQSFDYFVEGTYLNQRYGAAKTGGFAVFEHAKPPEFVDGLELTFLLRKKVVAGA